jgi:glutathione-regulated potassium-efflux system ancillary protein KefF
VLAPGWAWGPGGNALRGKPCLWAVTTGGDELDYSPQGIHRHPFETFGMVMRQTAEFCGMRWLAPFVLHEARQLGAVELRGWGEKYRARVVALAEADGDG